ncbi:hypothetical protein MC885_010986 [Smutsia gigantea]|nr:hypothetical protein MC885_010986 [Smutsia gigantea]
MEPRVVRLPGQDLVVGRLKSRYGLGGGSRAEYDFSNFDQAKCNRRSLSSPDDLDILSSGDKVGSSLRCYSEGRKHCTTPFCSSFKHLNVNCLDELDSFRDLKQQETEEELIEKDHRVSSSKVTKQSFKEKEKAVARPTNLASNSRNWTEYCSDAYDSPLKCVSFPTSNSANKQSLLPHQINQIYEELFQIHQKLQLNEVSEENRKMEIQAKRVQARLDNLQRKYEFMTIQRLKGIPLATHEMKSLKQEKVSVSKTNKEPQQQKQEPPLGIDSEGINCLAQDEAITAPEDQIQHETSGQIPLVTELLQFSDVATDFLQFKALSAKSKEDLMSQVFTELAVKDFLNRFTDRLSS